MTDAAHVEAASALCERFFREIVAALRDAAAPSLAVVTDGSVPLGAVDGESFAVISVDAARRAYQGTPLAAAFESDPPAGEVVVLAYVENRPVLFRLRPVGRVGAPGCA